jgi:protoporphyrinogen oxidase
MNTDWLGDYVPKNSRIKMLSSIFNILSEAYGRNFKYYYPSEGGISVLPENISSHLLKSPIYRSSLEKIFVDEKVALFSNGNEVNYDYLINTIPLNSFLNKLDSLPSEISNSLKLLKKNSTTLLHVLGKGIITRSDHWIYIPDPAIPFYRITIPGNINPANCPVDHFALTLEFGGNVFEHQVVFEKSISALKAMGLLTESNSDIEYYWKLLDCSYVIYDEDRESALKNIFSFLRKNKILSIGRYGAWEYSNMEDAILHGKNAASQLLNEAGTGL